MAARIIRKSWWVDFRFDHIRYRKRSPENTKAGALAYEASLRHRLARGEEIAKPLSTGPPDESFEDFASRWFDDYVRTNNKRTSHRIRKSVLTSALVPFFGKLSLAQITANCIEQFKARQIADGIAGSTINFRLAILRACLNTAQEWGALHAPPPKIRLLKQPPARTDYFSTEECQSLLSYADGLMYEMLLISLRTGMRQGELRGLQWGSIDWQNRILTVRHSLSDETRVLDVPKSNRERHIPLDSEVYDLLLVRRKSEGYVFTDEDGEPYFARALNCRLENVCKKAGLRRITWHVLRHTFATQLSMTGAPLNSVQSLLGHSAITTTMRYAHVAPSTLRTAIELLSPDRTGERNPGQLVGNRWQDLQWKKAA